MVWSSDLIWAAWRGMVAAVEWLMTCCRGACCAAEDGMGFADNLLHTLIFPRKLMVGTSFGLTIASNHFFLIATKHKNYNKKVSKQQAYKKRK
jgi:hypothetical protein